MMRISGKIKMLSIFMAVVMTLGMIPAAVAMAEVEEVPIDEDASQIDISSCSVTVTSPDMVYNGSKQTVLIEVTDADGSELVEGVDYVLNAQTEKAAGTYTATITGMGNYCSTTTVKYTIAKANQKLTVKVKKTGTKKYTIKASKLQKDSKTFKLKVSKKGNMKVRYSCANSKIKVDNNGIVTLKEGLGAGTYKIKVTTGASKNYKANKNPKYITVKVK